MKRRHCVGLGAMILLVVSTVGTGMGASAESIPSPPAATDKEKTEPPVVTFSDGLLSVTAKDADIRALVESISAKSGVDIVLDTAIVGKVTVEFKDVKFEEGLKTLLKDIVEGGFSSEYIKKTGEKDGSLRLAKVVIARLGPTRTDGLGKPVVKITDISVQDAKGEEVVFARWGSGKDEIPLLTEEIDGHIFRKGFERLRIGDDGTIYFVNWAHRKIYIYDKDGRARIPFEIPVNTQTFLVDHEGNIYFLNANKNGPSDIGVVHVYRPDGSLIETVKIPESEAGFSPYAVIDDGILRNPGNSEFVYDFRRLLREPQRHAQQRHQPFLVETLHRVNESISHSGWELRLEPIRNLDEGNRTLWHKAGWRPSNQWVDAVGYPDRTLDVSLPAGWRWGDDHASVLGADNGGRIYLLESEENDDGIRFSNNYTVVVVDPEKRSASFNRLKELDNYVYEKGGLTQNFKRFDLDAAGNVFHLFTTKEGVHVYRYGFGGQP